MKEVKVKHASKSHLAEIVAIYNHYILYSAATFDVAPKSIDSKSAWFSQFAQQSPHQLLVALVEKKVVGYACSAPFNSRQAYHSSAETSIYVKSSDLGHGIGKLLYDNLFSRLANHPLHRLYAGITLPNKQSVALHESFGFKAVGKYSEVGHKFDRYWDVHWFEKCI